MINGNILTDWEKEFIAFHGLAVEDFYDARGESKFDYYLNAKNAGCGFVIHNYCRESHRLKDRHGHCIVCHPEYIAFQKRGYSGGAIYVAESGEYCKVGTVDNQTGDIDFTITNRNNSLNAEGGYGGIQGWKITKFYIVNHDLGALESSVHILLKPFEEKREYRHNGNMSTTKEVFRCPLETAVGAVEDVLNTNK